MRKIKKNLKKKGEKGIIRIHGTILMIKIISKENHTENKMSYHEYLIKVGLSADKDVGKTILVKYNYHYFIKYFINMKFGDRRQ